MPIQILLHPFMPVPFVKLRHYCDMGVWVWVLRGWGDDFSPKNPISLRQEASIRVLYTSLTPRTLLARRSLSLSSSSDGDGRLGGFSPTLSLIIFCRLIQPMVSCSWKPSAVSCSVATRQRSFSSSCKCCQYVIGVIGGHIVSPAVRHYQREESIPSKMCRGW